MANREIRVAHACSKIIIDVSADALWQVIGDFGTACKYLAGVVNCTVDGEGVGVQRLLTSADGSIIVERLESLDPAAHRLSYTLLTDTPFRNCLTIMIVHELGPSQSELEWSSTFEADGLPVDEAREMLEGALAVNCLALKQFLEADRK
jgi:hypothetical protein